MDLTCGKNDTGHKNKAPAFSKKETKGFFKVWLEAFNKAFLRVCRHFLSTLPPDIKIWLYRMAFEQLLISNNWNGYLRNLYQKLQLCYMRNKQGMKGLECFWDFFISHFAALMPTFGELTTEKSHSLFN